MKVITIPVGFIQENTYILFDEITKEGIIVDPGGDGESAVKIIQEHKIKIKYILLTHGHYDHIESVEKISKITNAKVISHKEEEEVTSDPNINLSIEIKGVAIKLYPDILLEDNDIIEVCNKKIKLIHTPGHTPGGVCFYIEEDGILISGDTLFFESVGRTDFPRGDYNTLNESITKKLLILPDNVTVLPGHGRKTTIGHEKKCNTFVTV
jgi:hydroxyacylglutathione hydrolase